MYARTRAKGAAVGLAGLAAALVVLIVAPGTARTQEHVDQGPHLFVVSDDGTQVAALANSSARVVARYEAFTLVEATGEDAERLVEAGADLRDDMRELTVDGRSFDPTSDRAPLVGKGSAPENPGLALIQFVGPTKGAWLARLGKTGVRVVTYMAQNGYLVHGSAAELREVGSLVGSDPAVRAVVPYRTADKLAVGLRSAGTQRVAVQTISGGAGTEARQAVGSAAAGSLRDRSAVGPFRTQFVRLSAAEASQVASDGGVVAVLPDPEPELLDERQAQILANNVTGPDPLVPTGPGYFAFHEAIGLGAATFPFTVDVTDSGIDDGTTATTHPDFHVDGVGANPSRITYVNDFTSDPDARDCGGHGTINAGIVGGYNTGTGSSGAGAVEDASGFNYDLGIAPRAGIGGSKIFTCAGSFSLTSSFTALTTAAYNAGARISNNSWGANVAGAYNANSQEYDSLVRDADPVAAENQQMVELFSAGNAGSGPNTVGAPGTAKNVITVGASEGVNPTGTDGCAVTDAGADDAHDMATFSSRGPTDDGRTKPDLVGPGTHITGAKPQHASYSGSGVCTAVFPTGSTLYSLSSGTSHATPAVAGMAALIREWYRINHGGGTAVPSPALTKAILANTATDLVGGVGIGGNVPNSNQGWGLGNLAQALAAGPRYFRDQEDTLGASGATFLRTFEIQNTANPVHVTLAYTDTPGPTSGNSFVNDLDLTVSTGSGTFKGNVFSGGVSATGGVADPRNNLESVYLPAGTSGNFAVEVIGTNIAGDGVPGNPDTTDQDFALVVSNAAEVSAPVLSHRSTTTTPTAPEDGDAVIEPGERFTVTERIENVGTLDATGISGTLSSASPVTLPDPTAVWPNLAVGVEGDNSDPLIVRMSPAAACGTTLDLSLAITASPSGGAAVPITVGTGGVGTAAVRDSSDVPKAIPDNSATGVSSNLVVADAGVVKDVNVRIGSLTHTWVGDLKIDLMSPTGTIVNLVSRPGGTSNNDNNLASVTFDDEAATAIGPPNPGADATPAYTGTFRPQADQLSRFNGEAQNGTWVLTVSDLAGADTGSLDTWGLDIAPAACDYVPETTPPLTTITSGPTEGSTTDDTTPTFAFVANEPATFECQLDAGAFAPCTSPFTSVPLAPGPHRFSVRATDLSDNVEASAPVRNFTVQAGGGGGSDTIAPETTIDKQPKAKVKRKKASFEFSANEPATFECSLDETAFSPCASPTEVKVKKGRHSFKVRATDLAGNQDRTPAEANWKRKKKRRR